MGEAKKSTAKKFSAKAVVIVLTCVAAGLLIAGFIVPPTGVIDPSVLTGSGILAVFAAIFVGIDALERGVDAEIKHKDTTIKLNND